MEGHPDLMHQIARTRCDERRERSLTAFTSRATGTAKLRRRRREHGLLLTLAAAIVSRRCADAAVRPLR